MSHKAFKSTVEQVIKGFLVLCDAFKEQTLLYLQAFCLLIVVFLACISIGIVEYILYINPALLTCTLLFLRLCWDICVSWSYLHL